MTSTDFEKPEDQEAASNDEAPQTPTPEQAPAEPVRPEREMSMADVNLDAGPAALSKGDIVTGVVAEVRDDIILVDVGGKSEGIIQIYEFADESEIPKRDDKIEVAVVKTGDDEEGLILSKKRADYERMWNRIVDSAENGEVLDAMVTERVKGGLRVDIGVSGFVPASHVATRDVRNLDRFVGQVLRLKVLEADRANKKVVLSHRLVVEEERDRQRAETLARLHEGLVCEGKVRSLTKYGAFIDLGGVDGLLHVSEMSWGRVAHPSDVCKVGETLRVVVLEIDMEKRRISLGRREILPDPWKEAAKTIKTGNIITGKISRIVRPGAFVELLGHDIEGFLPIGELADKRIEKVSEIISEGQELQLKVLKMSPTARRMTLSLIAAEQEKEREEYQKYMSESSEETPTLGDQFGDLLGAVEVAADEEPEDAPVEEVPVEEEVVEEELDEEESDEEESDEDAVNDA